MAANSYQHKVWKAIQHRSNQMRSANKSTNARLREKSVLLAGDGETN